MGRVLGSSRVTSRYQVTMPKNVRRYLKLLVGDELVYVLDDSGRIYVTSQVIPIITKKISVAKTLQRRYQDATVGFYHEGEHYTLKDGEAIKDAEELNRE